MARTSALGPGQTSATARKYATIASDVASSAQRGKCRGSRSQRISVSDAATAEPRLPAGGRQCQRECAATCSGTIVAQAMTANSARIVRSDSYRRNHAATNRLPCRHVDDQHRFVMIEAERQQAMMDVIAIRLKRRAPLDDPLRHHHQRVDDRHAEQQQRQRRAQRRRFPSASARLRAPPPRSRGSGCRRRP